MNPEFWLERWQRNEIGFHQAQINPYLQKYWPDLQPSPNMQIFVPLCGKSQDMLWLLAQGCAVLGVELSGIAVKDFFQTHDLVPILTTQENFLCATQDKLCMLQGDYFNLTPQQLSNITHVYDRAALVALPPEMRSAYVQHLIKILPPKVQILLLAFEYDQAQMNGPPFAVTETEIKRLYEPHFDIHILTATDALAENQNFQQRGLTWLQDKVYLLTPR